MYKIEYLDAGQTKIITNSTKIDHEKWLGILINKYGAEAIIKNKTISDDFPSNETLARAGYMTYVEAGLVDDPLAEQIEAVQKSLTNKESEPSDGYNYNPMTRQWS